ncbi:MULTISPECIES: glycoside hydrolase family 18 protein [unclassified Legionella]|uniref:glycosyl hydrolase family 18 protein n=1 Tax=unclassified Legionella TaxID=2622702 RepID=UPI001056A7D8|nr:MULTISPECIES: glycoside hydrolase family 18 protein [unclassified Legionella]MDI9819169.1 glycoside hydrolase family 18 protein [Legionella sp. PL877]
MKKILVPSFIMGLTVYFLSSIAYADRLPFCTVKARQQPKIIAYLGADSGWSLQGTDLSKLSDQLAQVTLVNYSFAPLVRDNQGNTVLALNEQDSNNIELLRQMKPDLPIMLAVGGWGERDGFRTFLADGKKRAIFIRSVKQLMEQYQLDGIDVDWENELLASKEEISSVAALLNELHDTLGKKGYCVSNAVPATSTYWVNYPDAGLWQNAVDWTTIMAYDHYGTFGPKTELGASLYEKEENKGDNYPYPNTSGDQAVSHFFHQGLPADKIILGLPFYCHSYYIKNEMIDSSSQEPGLHVPVLDPNINSQVSYNEAYDRYGEQLFNYRYASRQGYFSSYGMIPLEKTGITRFISCDSPSSIKDKIEYVSGSNPLSAGSMTQLAGVSFWSLQQDLPVSHPGSLLRAIVEKLNN